ncbi:hypothetical protein D9611_015026 [Ephemerocybe angulata]|uniref:Uncharacterized protein n=1 Tax=Ephemerocybe angulata TaxID=980116 RepID=A0A8H5FIE4_9AGAR|nr:hypothetical protein D9611_015026 [Tulosesus angulatus]
MGCANACGFVGEDEGCEAAGDVAVGPRALAKENAGVADSSARGMVYRPDLPPHALTYTLTKSRNLDAQVAV